MLDKLGTILFDMSFVAIKDDQQPGQEATGQSFTIKCNTDTLDQAHQFILSRILDRTIINTKNGAASLLFRATKSP